MPTEAQPTPHDLDAEGALLGWILDHPTQVLDGLEPKNFYSEANRRIFEAFQALSGEDWDLVRLASELHDRGRLEQVGGTPYLVQLLEQPACHDPSPHVARVRELWARRELASLANEARYSALSGTADSASVLHRLRGAIELVEAAQAPNANERLSARDIFARVPPTHWVSQPLDFCRPSPPALIGGFAYSGKTAAAQALALSVAVGVPIWGSFSCTRGHVLHADWEQGARLSRKRYHRLAYGMDLSPEELFSDNWLSYQLLGPYLTEPGAEAYWTRACEGKELFILDSLRALAPGIDENSSDFRKVIDLGFRISERTGCLVIFLVHGKKPGQNDTDDGRMKLRGSSAIFDAASSVLLLELQKESGCVRVTHEKAREGGHPLDPFRIRFIDVDDGQGDATAGLLVRAEGEPTREHLRAVQNASQDAMVLEGVQAHPWLSTRQLASVLGIERGRLQSSLDRLELSRKVIWRSGPNRSVLWGPCEEASSG